MKKSNRAVLTALASLALIAALPTTALAGERGGNGEPTPVNGYIASSLCAFSGLDDLDFQEPVQPGVVQNWGAIPKEGRDFFDPSTTGGPVAFHPGNACNPNGDPIHE